MSTFLVSLWLATQTQPYSSTALVSRFSCHQSLITQGWLKSGSPSRRLVLACHNRMGCQTKHLTVLDPVRV